MHSTRTLRPIELLQCIAYQAPPSLPPDRFSAPFVDLINWCVHNTISTTTAAATTTTTTTTTTTATTTTTTTTSVITQEFFTTTKVTTIAIIITFKTISATNIIHAHCVDKHQSVLCIIIICTHVYPSCLIHDPEARPAPGDLITHPFVLSHEAMGTSELRTWFLQQLAQLYVMCVH